MLLGYVKKTYAKFQQEFRFIIVGVINTIVGYGSYFILVKTIGIYYLLAQILSYIIGTTNSYLWNKFFTFKSSKKSISEVLRFISVYVVSLLINLGLLKMLVDYIGVDETIAGIPTLFVTTLVSYFGHRFFSFRKT
jgi:Predicted membrane protein